jgi:hypothetical protein
MARLRPSASHTFYYCAASVQSQERHPQADTDDTLEGTAAHWVGSECLESFKANKAQGIKIPFDFIGSTAPNGVVIDEGMADSADTYVNSVLMICGERGLLQKLNIEKHVKIPRVHPTECEGTPDANIWDESTLTLDVWDFKHGHRTVETRFNPQLVCYAVGLVDLYTGGKFDPNLVTINFRIVQPRSMHVDGVDRCWSVKLVEIIPMLERLISQGAKALGDNPEAVTGNHCADCSALLHCQAAIKASMNGLDFAETIGFVDIEQHNLKPYREQLKRAHDIIKKQLSSVESEIEALIENGQQVYGLTLDNKRGSLKWSKPENEIRALANLMKVDLFKDKPITPNQAKKLISPEIIKLYSQPSVGKKIIVDVETTRAFKVFSAKPKGNTQ